MGLHRDDIVHLLLHQDPETVRAMANDVRRNNVGEHVFVRGLIEFSNHCVRDCHYCGLRRSNLGLARYRLGGEALLAAVEEAVAAGVDTIVLQSGDDLAPPARELAEIIATIRERYPVAVTLSVGERSDRDYALWHAAGASRFLMKHETADPALYARLHPGRTLAQRLDRLRTLRDMGYAIGSGFIVGLPGQSVESLAADILLVRQLGVSMCGAGPFVPQADTPCGGAAPGSVELSLRVLSVLRIALPRANLPATTALATLDPVQGQCNGLKAGANVLMPSFTPPEARAAYRIYDNKIRVGMDEARAAIAAAGRTHGLP